MPFHIMSCRYTSESDVCRRQIPTSKVDPRTERLKICIMPPPQLKIYNGHRPITYVFKAERAN